VRAFLHGVQGFDRARLRARAARHPGLRLHPGASSNLAVARYALGPGARLELSEGVVTERLPGRLHFHVGAGAHVSIGAGTWLRTEIGEVHVVAFDGARLEIGAEGFLNGCHLSAKRELRLGTRVWVGPGSRVFDSDQHDLDAEHPERTAPVAIHDHVWIASDVTVLRGVTIGAHCVVGARSLVTRDLPAHSLAYGQPAAPHGRVGDRSRAR
jgi:acetyltransferase-like isoleucine patch superfamily enzyme